MSVSAPHRPSSDADSRCAPRKRRRKPPRRTGLAAFALAGPFTVLLVGTVLIPVAYAVYLSLFTDRFSGLGFESPRRVFIALGNYWDVLADPAFQVSIRNVVAFALIQVPLMIALALVLAMLLDSAVVRLKQMWSLAVFLPYALPGVIAGLIWAYLYSPGIGPIADLLPFDPLSSGAVLSSIVNIATWQWVGYNVIIFYTALQAVPKELTEAAHVDGAGAFRIAYSIKTPMIKPTIFVSAVFSIIGSLQLFTEPLILRTFTSAVNSTWTPSLYVYESAFVSGDYGRAAAAAVILALASAVLSALVMRLSKRSNR